MWKKSILVAIGTSSVLGHNSHNNAIRIAPKYYVCNESTGFCELQPLTSPDAPHVGTSQQNCLITCRGTIWPAPSDIQEMVTGSVSEFCEVSFIHEDMSTRETYDKLAEDNFLDSLALIQNSKACDYKSNSMLKVIMKRTDPTASSNDPLTLDTDESYSLHITSTNDGVTEATITSATFYGGRHGLETLTQLIATDRDPMSSTYGVNTIANSVKIQDSPAFPYRGVMLDTSRHYLSMDSIKTVIRGMGYNKLNRLHLHLTDTASFPLFIPDEPNLFMYGGYTSDMYYDETRIKELMTYAHSYGVSVIPEVDVPSHVNMGWNWGQLEGVGDLAICTPDWTATALEPPAGHLNIANPAVYPILENIYSYMGEQFNYPDIFHVGGDEVVVGSDETSAACWNSTEYGGDILNLLTSLGLSRDSQESFYVLWHRFTHRIVDMISNVYTTTTTGNNPRRAPKNIIWGGNVEPVEGPSPVTYNMVARDDVTEELPPDDYIMEIWDDSADSIAPSLLQKGYQVIAVNYDYVYLDCGQPGFTNPGGYWCGPEHEWSHIYQYMHDLQSKWELTSEGHALNGEGSIIGSEVLLWGEENGDSNVMTKIFPRAAALAEGLWSNPQAVDSKSARQTEGNVSKSMDDLWYRADPRMQLWRNTLTERGVSAAAMQPLWCTQKGPYACTIDEGKPQ